MHSPVTNQSVPSINHSVIHSVSQYISQSGPIVALNYLPLFEMGFN